MTRPVSEKATGLGFPGQLPGLRSIDRQLLPDAESLYNHLKLSGVGRLKSFRPIGKPCYRAAGQVHLQGLVLLAGEGSACEFVLEPVGLVSLVASFSGVTVAADPMGSRQASPGSAMLLPCCSDERLYSCTSLTSNAALLMNPAAIRQAAAAIAGLDPGAPDPDPSDQMFRLQTLNRLQSRTLFSLLRYIDSCLAIDPNLPEQLGLDDVVLRLIASWLHPDLLSAPVAEPRPLQDRRSRTAFDELLDHIRANLDQPLRLTDLEARSFYSRRALQYAFREKLGCTPTQWIREQRLSRAMEQLQSQGEALSIRAVALACGYRQSRQFSTDFRRRFGLCPSQVRRAPLN